MKRLIIMTVALAFVLCLGFTAQADKIDRRAEEATNIVVGKIKQVKSFHATNKWNDDLIMSQVTLKVDKALKGEQQNEVTFIVEGGTVGDIVLRVSSVPLFEEGEAITLYLKKKENRFEYLDSEGKDVSVAKAKPSPPSKPTLPCCKTFAKWPSLNVPFYINPNASDMSPDCVDDVINAGAAAWNIAISKSILHYAGSTDKTSVSSSDENAIFFRDDPSGSTIAVTYIWYARKGGSITAFDMIFYDSWAFFDLLKGCNDTNCQEGFYLQSIAAHEFGHAIGLDHNRCANSLMYPYASYCEENLISTDDTNCVQNLYP